MRFLIAIALAWWVFCTLAGVGVYELARTILDPCWSSIETVTGR